MKVGPEQFLRERKGAGRVSFEQALAACKNLLETQIASLIGRRTAGISHMKFPENRLGA
jgi:hypothetical protein